MTVLGDINIADTPTDASIPLMHASMDMKDEFQKWLVDGNAKKVSPQVAIECLDRISKYVISEKIACSIWEISKSSVFKAVYQKVMDAKLLRIMERKTYKTFILVGQLYLKFLKEKPWKATFNNPVIATAHNEPLTQSQLTEENKPTQTVIDQAQGKANNFLFRKDVDLSLLKYGFTIPQSAIDAFCSNISIKVPRGGSYHISIVVKGKAYPATLSNVGFSSETRQQMQVRYSQTSPIANTLRSVFGLSNDLFISGKQAENNEYIEVVCVSTDEFELICYPSNSVSTVKLEDTIADYVDNSALKIGAYIRGKMWKLSNSGFVFSEQQIQDICDLHWGKEALKLASPHPFAKIVDGTVAVADLAKDEYGYNRYWNQVFSFGEVNLILSSQWYERNRVYFNQWFSSLGTATEEVTSRHINNDDRRKYAPLKQWLVDNTNASIRVSFSDISDLVGGLPPSAYQHRAFWSNTNSHAFSVAWMEAGYKVVGCDLQSQNVRFAKVGEASGYARSTSRMTIKAAMIEYSNTYVGTFKTRKEICDELTAKYGFPTQSVLPADYEVSLSNPLPKLFRRIGHGTYECLGYSDGSTTIYHGLSTMHYALDEIDQNRVKHIIASKFKSGYRTASSIDFERFKNYYADEYSKDFESDADSLDALVKSVAVVFDDRAYMYDEEVVETVRAYLDQMDSPCIYIHAFFEKYSGELYTFGIFSVDILRAFIEKTYADVFCKRDYVYLQPDISPSDLIRQVFVERETWSFDELFDRLPCLKQDTIRATLNGSDYHRIETGVYMHIENMDLPDSEGKNVDAFVRKRLQSKDYVIANELDLTRFETLNPHCPFSAIRDAVFNKFLSNNYIKSGQVITRIGEKLRVLDILEQYCREAETASFEELNSFEATFDPEGRTHSTCLIAAHNVMVRVSADLFVKESKVSFDVDRTDEAIALYCQDNFIPLKKVVDFSLFPYAGYPWNLFLLESYVRKLSCLFKYDVRAVNSANIGVIVRKSFTYGEYDDLLAIALAESSLSLNNKKAVGDYLFDNGYIGWRNLGRSEGKILTNAKKIREGGAV